MTSEWRHFTDRQALRRPDDGGLISGNIPDRVRNAVAQYLMDGAEPHDFLELWELVVRGLDLEPYLVRTIHSERELMRFITTCTWPEFLDVCELIFDYTQTAKYTELDADAFRNTLNERLLRYYSAYLMDDEGRIQEPGSAYAEQAIEETRILLGREEFSGAERQFRGALEDFNRRPDADFEGCGERCHQRRRGDCAGRVG